MAGIRRKPILYDAGDELPPAKLWPCMPSPISLARLFTLRDMPPEQGEGEDASDVDEIMLTVLTEATERWEDVTDETGEQAECSAENKRLFYVEHPLARLLMTDWIVAQMSRRIQSKKVYGLGSSGASAPGPTDSTAVAPLTQAGRNTGAT